MSLSWVVVAQGVGPRAHSHSSFVRRTAPPVRGELLRVRREVLRKLNAARGGGYILQSDHSVPETVAPATLTLFSDLGLTYTRTLTTAERVYRYRTIESTIPIRNTMLLH